MKEITTKNNFYTVDELTGTAKTNAIKNYHNAFINIDATVRDFQKMKFETLMEEKEYETQFVSMTGVIKNSKSFNCSGICGLIDWKETRKIIDRLLKSRNLSSEEREYLSIADRLNTKFELNMEIEDNCVTVNDYFFGTSSYKSGYGYYLEHFVPLHKEVLETLARFIGNEMKEIHNCLKEVELKIHNELNSDEYVMGLMDGYMFDEHGNMAS